MSTITFLSQTRTEHKSWLVRPISWRITPAAVLLGAIVLLSLGLHLFNIQLIGDANTYYTAAVKSMLQSWKNFFFVAAEPGGSVTVDKPPLGLWIEAAFAAILGVSGFSVVLPNILAGVLSIPLLYHLVRKYFGVGSGLIAVLVLALTPVSLAVDRNNTIDSMLILTLLLAAWAFLNATETGRLRYLLLGVFLVGLGFNIKMLQAFLPLPAFYALFFFGAKMGWLRKIFYLGLASMLLIAVSLSWAVAVDLVPADQRPYVGGTSSNSELELIFGYNGINRLVGNMGGPQPGNGVYPPGAQPGMNQQGNFNPSNPPPNVGGAGMLNGGQGMMQETGQRGILRFFQPPLAKEMSWLLPFALVAMILAIFASRVSLPMISSEHKGLILWGGWLMICLVFFSAAGFFHNYYLATLSPALGALVGIGFSSLEKLKGRSHLLVVVGLCAASGTTLSFQLHLVEQFGLSRTWAVLAAVLFIGGMVTLLLHTIWKRKQGIFYRLANIMTLFSMLVIPALWSMRTITANTNAVLPSAYTGDNSSGVNSPGGFPGGARGDNFGGINAEMLAYLQANTQETKYLVAVPDSHTGSNLVLEVGRPVLFMGGFSGSDPVVDANDLARLVAGGELRYILYGGMQRGASGGSADIGDWLKNNCQTVPDFTQSSGQNPGMGGDLGSSLYQCSS